ncbi:MAG TPA: HAMP domain-containing sensor histidine kinase [Clostridiaceae bacterium]
MKGEYFKDLRMSIKFPNKTLQVAVSGAPIYDNEGNFILRVLCHRDMTDYFNQVEAIRSKYEFMDRMIDTFDLPVVRLSCTDLKIVDINKKGLNTLKLLRPDIISLSQIKDNKLEDLFKALETSEYYQCLNDVLREGKSKYLNKIALVINESNVFWNVISSTVQLFNIYYGDGSLDKRKDSIIKYIHSMRQNCFRLSKLIDNIVDISKIKAGFFQLNLSNNNIVEVVEAIVMSVTDFTDSKGLNIIFDTDIEEKIIACDPEKIERIVLNLLSNAIKFSNIGDEIFVDIKDKNELVEISIKDNGIGIEEKDFTMIFDRFKQVDKTISRNAEGTGI